MVDIRDASAGQEEAGPSPPDATLEAAPDAHEPEARADGGDAGGDGPDVRKDCWTITPPSPRSIVSCSAAPAEPGDGCTTRYLVRAEGIDLDGDGALDPATETVTSSTQRCATSDCVMAAAGVDQPTAGPGDPRIPSAVIGCDLRGTTFDVSAFRPVISIAGCNLRGETLETFNCGWTGFTEDESIGYCDLECADLRAVDLSWAGLLHPKVAAADLRGARLEHVSFAESDLALAKDLRDANLTGANLSGANLDGSDLEGVVLAGADLTQASATT